jgi:co-chaperonin GroES (HSP10)
MIQATGKRYIIKALELNKVSQGGIILRHSDETQFAQIVSVGPQVTDPLDVGAIVVIDWNHTVPVKHEDVTYHVVDSRAIAAIVEDFDYAS